MKIIYDKTDTLFCLTFSFYQKYCIKNFGSRISIWEASSKHFNIKSIKTYSQVAEMKNMQYEKKLYRCK